MKKEGFEPTIELDMDMLQDKQFHTYRKTKTANEAIYFKWNPMNLVNKSYVRKTDDAFNNVSLIASLSLSVNLLPQRSSCASTCQNASTRADLT